MNVAADTIIMITKVAIAVAKTATLSLPKSCKTKTAKISTWSLPTKNLKRYKRRMTNWFLMILTKTKTLSKWENEISIFQFR